jgi:uncharacterized protein (TIGR02600 family)
MIAHQLQPRRGIALIIVLAMLVLLSGLMVAFISTASTERSSSFANSGTISARQIADSTVNTVISTIREATTSPDEDVTWASQPGAIRTFAGKLRPQKVTVRDGAYYQNFSTTGDLVYKLYSADDMRVSAANGQIEPFTDEIAVTEGWNPESPEPDYVDINRPVLIPRKTDKGDPAYDPYYPILDPRALYNPDESENLGPTFGMVEGFDARITKDDNLTLESGSRVPYVPMPVRWLYVLRDGSMFSAKKLLENTSVLKNNPIIGRTAYWVDDDTCKLNVNTASEGTFWDTPTASGQQEAGLLVDSRGNDKVQLQPAQPTGLNLAASQPTRLEFQRYPGHPATTCLSPVLGALDPWNIKWNTSPYPLARSGNNYFNRDFKEAIYKFAPFIPYGLNTSIGGFPEMRSRPGGCNGARTIQTKHLYASPDEMLFKAPRFTSSNGMDLNTPDLKKELTPEALEKTKFFLTANSRAPENQSL